MCVRPAEAEKRNAALIPSGDPFSPGRYNGETDPRTRGLSKARRPKR